MFFFQKVSQFVWLFLDKRPHGLSVNNLIIKLDASRSYIFSIINYDKISRLIYGSRGFSRIKKYITRHNLLCLIWRDENI